MLDIILDLQYMMWDDVGWSAQAPETCFLDARPVTDCDMLRWLFGMSSQDFSKSSSDWEFYGLKHAETGWISWQDTPKISSKCRDLPWDVRLSSFLRMDVFQAFRNVPKMHFLGPKLAPRCRGAAGWSEDDALDTGQHQQGQLAEVGDLR